MLSINIWCRNLYHKKEEISLFHPQCIVCAGLLVWKLLGWLVVFLRGGVAFWHYYALLSCYYTCTNNLEFLTSPERRQIGIIIWCMLNDKQLLKMLPKSRATPLAVIYLLGQQMTEINGGLFRLSMPLVKLGVSLGQILYKNKGRHGPCSK